MTGSGDTVVNSISTEICTKTNFFSESGKPIFNVYGENYE
jgi:hypothetical protein